MGPSVALAGWSARVAPRRIVLEAHLEKRVKGSPPGAHVVVVRSSEDERRLSRLLGPGVIVTTLARFLGRAGPHGIEEEDLIPGTVLQWLVERTLPPGYKGAARQHLASVFLEAIHLLEENAIRPPYPGKARQEGERRLEAAHRALLEGLRPHHEAGRYAAFERVSLAREGASRLHVAYPAAEHVVFFGIDMLSRSEQEAVEHLLAQPAVEVAWYVLGSLPGAGDHPALAFTRPLVKWLQERGTVDELDDEEPRLLALRSLFSLSPGGREPRSGVWMDAPGAGDDEGAEGEAGAPRDRVDEVRRLLARVRGLMIEGVEPHEIGVVVPALQDYSGLLEDLFHEHGIPVGLSFRGTVRMGPVGSLLSGVLDALDRGLARDPVLDVAAHPLCGYPVRIEGERRVLNARVLRVRLQEAGANPRGLEGPGGWRQAVEDLRRREARERRERRERQERSGKDPGEEQALKGPSPWFEAQLKGALDLVARLDALERERDPERFLAGLRGFLDHVGLRERLLGAVRTAADPSWVLAGHEGVVELLDEVEEAFALGRPPEAGSQQVRDVIRRLLLSREIKAWADPEEGVQVIAWRGARFARFEHLFVLGATQGALPERDEAGAVEEVLGDRFGRDLVRLDRASEARRVLHQVLADTPGRVVFSAPRLQKDAPLVQSVLLDELAERFDLERAAPAGSDAVATPREAARVSVLEHRALGAPPMHLEPAWGLVAQRTHGVGDGSFAGRLLDERVRSLQGTRPVLAGGAVSASRLSRFAKCPFRSLVVDGLRLRAPWVRDEEIDPRDKGEILHDVLERYIRVAIERDGTPLRVVPGRRKAHEALLLEQALDVIEERRRRSVAFRAYEESMLGGLPGASNPYAGDPKGLLVRFLDDLERFGVDEGVLGVEVGFRDEGQEDPGASGASGQTEEGSIAVETPAGRVRLRGRIDRLDQVVDEEGSPGLRVVEYKSGSVPDRELVAGGVEFQLPLYAWVAGLLFPGMRVQEAVYHQLKRPRDKEAGIVEKVRFVRGGKNDLEPLVERTPQRVAQILEAQEAGRFPLTLLDEKEAGCDWCELRRGCGLRPEVTGLRREKARALKGEGPAVSGYVPDRLDLAADERSDEEGEGRGSS